MKMRMLLALGLCFAFTFQTFAQENKQQDSIYITPFAGCKIVLVGKSIDKLLKENNLEVLKNKFIEDYRESAKDKDFPAGAKCMIYLASQDGRRRLKAAPDENMPLNIEQEMTIFKSDLPPFHYTIYDLTKAFEYHIYVKDPEDLQKLATVNCTQLLAHATGADALKLKKYVSIEVGPTDTGFAIQQQRRNGMDAISLSGFVGAGLINSSFAPTIGLDVEFIKLNKYRKANFKVGSSYSFNVMADYQNKSFYNFYKFHSQDLHFLKNLSHTKEDFFLGLSIGKYFTDKLFGSAMNGSLDKAWKFGVINQFKSFGIAYDFIYDKNKTRNAAITLRYYF